MNKKKLDLKTFTDYISPNLGFMSPIKNKISEFINGSIKKDEKNYERKENISKNMKGYQLRRETTENKKKESNTNKNLPNVDNNNKNIATNIPEQKNPFQAQSNNGQPSFQTIPTPPVFENPRVSNDNITNSINNNRNNAQPKNNKINGKVMHNQNITYNNTQRLSNYNEKEDLANDQQNSNLKCEEIKQIMDNFEKSNNEILQNDYKKENNNEIKNSKEYKPCCGPNSMCQRKFNEIDTEQSKNSSQIEKLEGIIQKLEGELKEKEKKINDVKKQSTTMLYELDDETKKSIQNKISMDINTTNIKFIEKNLNKEIGLYKKIPKGIKRNNNQCYIISICNIINGFDGIHETLDCQTNLDIEQGKKDNKSLIIQELNNILKKLNDPKIKSDNINVNKLEEILCNTSPVSFAGIEFNKGRQSCPMSFLNYLFDIIRDKCMDNSPIKEKEPAYNFQKEKMQGVLTYETKCLGKFCTISEDQPFNCQSNFNLTKSPGNNGWRIEQDTFIKNNIVNEYKCSNYETNINKQGITKKFQKTTPGILMIQTELYKHENYNSPIEKRLGGVIPDKELTIPEFASIESKEVKYKLMAVVCHHGETPDSGHIYCYVRTKEEEWTQINDNYTTVVKDIPKMNQFMG